MQVAYAYAQYQDDWVKNDDGWRIKYRTLVYMVSRKIIGFLDLH